MPTLFTRIIKGEIPSEKILEDDKFFAFLDIRPINLGHTLVVPKLEIEALFSCPDEILSAALPFAKRVSAALQKAVPCERIGMMVAGFEVPHAHIHLIPINGEGELSFSRARAAQPGELAEIGRKIRAAL